MKLNVHNFYGLSLVVIFFIGVSLEILTDLDIREIWGVALAAIFSDMIIYGTYLVIKGKTED